jgi:hypothetical protein
MVKIPEIGETITIEWALELCRHFGFDYLVERISANPERYKPWKYDGCSCVLDQLLATWVGPGHTWRDITDECALPHDLQYAFGDPGNEQEKARADHYFKTRLIIYAGMRPEAAEAFRKLVEWFGQEKYGLDFSWGFARVDK